MTTGFHITHSFVSQKADGSDNTLVKPSNWNADHQILMDSGYILGNQSGANGPATQLACTSDAANLLAQTLASIISTLGCPTTGDMKPTFKGTADPGWVLMDDGTIGNASSGASNRANADTQNLFTLLYNTAGDTYVPLYTSTGAATTRAAQGTAAVAYGANCRISLPKVVGRVLAAHSLSGLGVSGYGGEATHTLATSELPAHTHNVTSSGSSATGVENQTITHNFSGNTSYMSQADPHSHSLSDGGPYVGTSGSGASTNGGVYGRAISPSISSTSINHYHSFSGTTGGQNANHTHNFSISVSGTTDNGTGGGGAHNNLQPFAVVNYMMKL